MGLQSDRTFSTIRTAVFGHAVGDALGVPMEFVSREYLLDFPVTDMLGHNSFSSPAGIWADDTSMTLCTLESLTETGRIDTSDMMERFILWCRSGYMTPNGKAFGIDSTTFQSITKYSRDHSAASCGGRSENDNGNGSLMRILPVILYQYFTRDTHIYG